MELPSPWGETENKQDKQIERVVRLMVMNAIERGGAASPTPQPQTSTGQWPEGRLSSTSGVHLPLSPSPHPQQEVSCCQQVKLT